MMVPAYTILDAGDMALVVEFGDRIDREISAWVNVLDERMLQAKVEGIIELVPTFRSLMIHFEPLVLERDKLIDRIRALMQDLSPKEGAGRQWRLPICYAPEMAPDLAHVADISGLSAFGVADCHASVEYHVYMLGFLPGQAYMGDNPGELVLPRRQEPRLTIPAGTLAIAMGMTSIFPQETPCGWHLIGRCPVPMWDCTTNTEPLLKANDRVRFNPISEREFREFRTELANLPARLTSDFFTARLSA